MISGTYVLTDQIDRGFKQVFTDAYKGIDVTVTRKAKFTGQLTGATEGLPQDMVEAGRRGRRRRRGVRLRDRHGRRRRRRQGGRDRRRRRRSSSRTRPTTSPRRSTSRAHPPEQPGEVAIIQKLAEDKKLELGSPITVITRDGAHEATRVRRVQVRRAVVAGRLAAHRHHAGRRAAAGSACRAACPRSTRRRTPGVSADTLATRVREALPAYAEVKTGAQAAADQTKAAERRHRRVPAGRCCSRSAASPCSSARSSSSTRSR